MGHFDPAPAEPRAVGSGRVAGGVWVREWDRSIARHLPFPGLGATPVIFTPELARRILTGRKTVTRRRVKPGETVCGCRPGRTYAVQAGRGKPEMARIEVVRVARQRLGDLTFADARAEGFRTTADFKAHWVRLHDRSWIARCAEPASSGDGLAPDRGLPDTELAARFDARHADTAVWAIEFRIAEQVRLLARMGSETEGDPSRGYTTNSRLALANEPEAVDDRALAKIVEAAKEKPRVAQRDVWQESRERFAAEIARLKGSELGRDVASSLRALERQLERLDRKIGRGA